MGVGERGLRDVFENTVSSERTGYAVNRHA